MNKIVLMLVAVLFVGTLPIYAETGIEALDACAKAMKYEKLDSVKTFQMKAYMYVQGQKVSINVYQKDDSLVRVEQAVPMMGKSKAFVIKFLDSEVEEYFQVEPTYEELDVDDAGEALSIMMQLIPRVPPIKPDDTTVKVEIVGKEKFNGKDCDKIEVKAVGDTTGNKAYYYLDVATHWLVGTSNTIKGSDGKEHILDMQLSGMKKLKGSGGFVYASNIKILGDGKKEYEFEIDSFTANPEVDDKLFAKP
jgi:hypothetical protein